MTATERAFARLWTTTMSRKAIQRQLGITHDEVDRIRTRLGLPKRQGQAEGPTRWRCQDCCQLTTTGPVCPRCAEREAAA
jgi:hypothetical protein